jgi:hypothetical protein
MPSPRMLSGSSLGCTALTILSVALRRVSILQVRFNNVAKREVVPCGKRNFGSG